MLAVTENRLPKGATEYTAPSYWKAEEIAWQYFFIL